MASPQPLSISHSYQGGGGSTSQNESINFDYSGLKNQLGREDEVDALHAQKYAALYGGDIPGSVGASHRIRNLLDQINTYASGASELSPHVTPDPLRKIDSISSSSSNDTDSPHYKHEYEVDPNQTLAPPATKKPAANP
jgi:hypothetical protein